MELVRIEQLLERYFEGTTSLSEENELREYFAGAHVAPQLQSYIPIFSGFTIAQEETSSRTVELPLENQSNRFFNWSIAASFVLLFGIFGVWYFNSDSGLTDEEQEALMAYNEAKETLLLLSENLNKGTSQIQHLQAFGEGASKINLINQFTKTKQRILK